MSARIRIIQQEIARLEKRYQTLTENLEHLEDKRILETRPEEELRLQARVDEVKQERMAVEAEITRLEEALAEAERISESPSQISQLSVKESSPVSEKKPILFSPPAEENAALLRPPRQETNFENPYRCWDVVTPPQFVGRVRELNKIQKAVEEKRSVSVVGDFQMGKSSVLQTLHRQLIANGRHVLVLSGNQRVTQSLSVFIEAVTGNCPLSEEPDQAADILARWIDQHHRNGLPPGLLIDDAESCFIRFPYRFFERLRGMLGSVVLIFTSSRELDLIRTPDHQISPLENRLELVRLGLLDPQAAETIIQYGTVFLDTEARQAMRVWAGRHPFYIQLLGSHLVNARLHGDALDEALQDFYSESAPKLRNLWQTLDNREQQALLDSLQGKPITRRSLRTRGLVTEMGGLFGKVLQEWLEQEV